MFFSPTGFRHLLPPAAKNQAIQKVSTVAQRTSPLPPFCQIASHPAHPLGRSEEGGKNGEGGTTTTNSAAAGAAAAALTNTPHSPPFPPPFFFEPPEALSREEE